jgi:4-hydroxy-4-methyl-2-oxoglutarate aldolase
MPTVIHEPATPACDRQLVEQWAPVGVTIASDVSGGIYVCDHAIRALDPAAATLCGPALTARCDPGDLGAVVHAIDRAKPGQVLVVDVGGRTEYSALGDLFAGAARKAGVAGIVVDGAIRDVGNLRTWSDFPIWTRANTQRAMPFKAGGEVNGVISCGCRTVRPGDLVIADANGVAILPVEAARELLAAALARVAFEQDCAQKIANGAKLAQLFGLPAAVACR